MPAEYVWECEHCGKAFDTKKECDRHEESCSSKKPHVGSETKFCQHCGKRIKSEAEICPKCGVRVKEAPLQREIKSSGVAAVLSFILPGLGQIYNGQIGTGIMFIIIAVILGLSVLLIIGIVLLPLFWILNVYHAYRTAKQINAGEIKT
jgi:TM2 domain-containing membrane protein YozV